MGVRRLSTRGGGSGQGHLSPQAPPSLLARSSQHSPDCREGGAAMARQPRRQRQLPCLTLLLCLLALSSGALAQVTANGTMGTLAPAPSGNNLPPSPPAAWAAMQKDCQLVFNVEIRGKYIIPFTSPKAMVIARVLKDRYLRSALLPDISVAALSTFTYLSYDNPTDADPLPSAPTTTAGRRRLARDLLQLEKSGAELKIIVATNAARVDSEIWALEDGVESGAMAQDFTLAGIDTENLTMLAPPYTEDLIGPGNTQEGGNSSFKV